MAPAVCFRRARAAFFGAVWAVLTLPPLAAYAQQQRVELTYIRDEGAQSCPDEAWLKQQIAGHLGYDPFIVGHSGNPPGARQVSCRLAKAHNADEFVAVLQTAEPNLGPVGRRELRSGPSCDALAASVVLSLSMAIDPIAAETPRAPAQAPAPSVTPPAPVPSTALAPVRLRLTGAGAVATGWQNASVTPLVSLDVHMQRGAWSVFVEARASASSSTREPSLRTRLLLGGLGICRAWGAFSLCGASVAGPMLVTSSGFEEERNFAALLAAGPRVLWSRALAGPLTVEAGLEAYANVVRPRVLVDEVVTWRAAAGTAAVTLGLGWRLP